MYIYIYIYVCIHTYHNILCCAIEDLRTSARPPETETLNPKP